MKLQNNNNILCTVSAGYSSGLMAIKMKEWYPNHNIINVFINVGKEHIKSLEFIKKIDEEYNLNIIYLEPSVNLGKRKSSDYKVVDKNNLDTSGINFEKGIQKYGIASVANKWCTREMKNNPIKKYADYIFGLNNYSIAIGIRYDEIDRISKNYNNNNIFYPLFDNKITTKDRNKFWDKSNIKIEIPSYKGNCDFCFEKSFRKLLTIYSEDNSVIDWWYLMEEKYSDVLIDGKKQYNELLLKDKGSYFNRGNKSIKELVKMAERPFKKATDEYIYEDDLFDLEEECGTKCEIFK